jgi:hypothetical protein
MSSPKSNWRERLAALPPDRQEVVKAAIRETLRLRREKLAVATRKNAVGDPLH